MTKREEEITFEAQKHGLNCMSRINYQNGFIHGATWADKTMIEKICKCYCDDLCEKGMCGMCYYKHDENQQIVNTFKYNECEDLKLIRSLVE